MMAAKEPSLTETVPQSLSPRSRRVGVGRKAINLVNSVIGFDIAQDAMILDFGCGAGATVYELLDGGYRNTYGYDVRNYLRLRQESDRANFRIATRTETRLPFADGTFDLIISNQVFEHVKDQATAFRELHRITKPGGHHMHIIPSGYSPYERHRLVPLGIMIKQRWWWMLWALLGVRNRNQQGMTAAQTADDNMLYLVDCLNYVSTSAYKVLWRKLGFSFQFVHQQFFDSHSNLKVRTIGKVNRTIPIVGWLFRVLKVRYVYLQKRT